MANGYPKAMEEEKINSNYQKLLGAYKQSYQCAADNMKKDKRAVVESGSSVLSWQQMLESMDDITDSIAAHDDDLIEEPIDAGLPATTDTSSDAAAGGDDELLDQLNKLFTPVLIMQGFETSSTDQIQEAMSEAAVFTEKNVIQFDDDTRMAQLISVCALLIARQKNSEKYQMFSKAHKVRKQMKLDIQKEEYDAAKTLAQKYLVKVSTTNNSSVARDAAKNLLPETQH